MEKQEITPKMQRHRKFMLALPLLVLPFLTLAFWALGGGKMEAAEAASIENKGFNLSLPGANLKDDKPLSDFLSLVQQDGRIGSTHIAVYVALWKFRMNDGFANPIQVFSRDVMQVAKISWRNTFYNCVNDLSNYGYIKYEPSRNRNAGSKIYFPEDNEN